MVKLANKATTYRLHSHDVKYGSGSGQQSVTAYPKGNDPNSYFRVEKEGCDRGVAVACNQVVQFTHIKTNTKLHSHLVARCERD